jgi:hypothetical protein
MTFVRISRRQSTAARRAQPAARTVYTLLVVGILGWLVAPPARAQRVAKVARQGEPFLSDTGGVELGRLSQGALVAVGTAQGSATPVALEGWIIATSVQHTDRDGHDLAVSRPENLRAAPNGQLVARLVRNALLDSLETRGGWVHVRRNGWVATQGLAAAPAAAQVASTAGADSADTAADAGVVVLGRQVQLYRNPDAPASGVLEAGSPVRVTERAGEWLRVETSGWVRERDVRRAGAQDVTGVTAADLRNSPNEWKGKVLRWTIQFISLQTADDLRPDFTPGEHYILARGPGPEYAFIYLIVPPEKLAQVSRLQPLDSITVLARVVSGRSTILANPILELLDIVP